MCLLHMWLCTHPCSLYSNPGNCWQVAQTQYFTNAMPSNRLWYWAFIVKVIATDGEKKNNISFNTFCGKLKSMRLNSVLKFDRISDDQQWQQTWNRTPFIFFEQTKPLSGLNGVQCGQDNGSLSILLEFILKIQLFQCFTVILKRGSDTMQAEFWNVLMLCRCVHVWSPAAGEPHRRGISEWSLSKTLRLPMVVFLARDFWS